MKNHIVSISSASHDEACVEMHRKLWDAFTASTLISKDEIVAARSFRYDMDVQGDDSPDWIRRDKL